MSPQAARRSLLLAGLLALAGCAAPVRTVPLGPEQWNGRLGLQVQADGNQDAQSFSASFELQGRPEAGRLQLFSPLGSVLAQLEWTPGRARLTQGGDTVESASLDELVQRLLGQSLPIPALFVWLAGQAQSTPGWEVDLSRHADGRIVAQRHSPLPQATLRVVLEH